MCSKFHMHNGIGAFGCYLKKREYICEEMLEILEMLHKYVPSKNVTGKTFRIINHCYLCFVMCCAVN